MKKVYEGIEGTRFLLVDTDKHELVEIYEFIDGKKFEGRRLAIPSWKPYDQKVLEKVNEYQQRRLDRLKQAAKLAEAQRQAAQQWAEFDSAQQRAWLGLQGLGLHQQHGSQYYQRQFIEQMRQQMDAQLWGNPYSAAYGQQQAPPGYSNDDFMNDLYRQMGLHHRRRRSDDDF